MILRKPTAIPLRPEDLKAFQDMLAAKKQEKEGEQSREGSSEMNVEDSAGQSGAQTDQPPVDMTEANRKTRAQMTTWERLGIA
jgi:hypothetical protein